jgi:hypothetical protein
MPSNRLMINPNGVPTDIEVKKLFEQIGLPNPGTVILYSQIEAIIGIKRNAPRWSSILSAWRKKLRRNNFIYTKAIKNEGLRVMTGPEQLIYGEDGIKRSIKAMESFAHAIVAIQPDRLSDGERQRADHAVVVASSTKMHFIAMAKKPTYPELDRAVAGSS